MPYVGFIHSWHPRWAEAVGVANHFAPIKGRRLAVRRWGPGWIVTTLATAADFNNDVRDTVRHG